MLQHFSQPACTSSSVGEARAPSHGGGREGGRQALWPPATAAPHCLLRAVPGKSCTRRAGLGELGWFWWEVLGEWLMRAASSLELPWFSLAILQHWYWRKTRKRHQLRLLPTAKPGHKASYAGRAPLGTVGQPAQTCQPQKPLGNVGSTLVQLGDSWHGGGRPPTQIQLQGSEQHNAHFATWSHVKCDYCKIPLAQGKRAKPSSVYLPAEAWLSALFHSSG